MKYFANYRTVTPLLMRYRRGIAVGMFFLLLTNVFTFLAPWILKVAVDDLQGNLAARKLLTYCALILLAALLQGICRFAMRRILIGISRHIEYHLRNTLFRHLLDLPPSFFQTMSTGDIMSRATSDIEAVRMATGPGIMHLFNTMVTFLIAFGSMLSLHRGLTLFAFAPMPFVAFLMYSSARYYHKRFLLVQEQRALLNGTAQENFSGIRVVKAYGQEEYQRSRFAGENREYMRRNITLANTLGFFHSLVGAVAGMGTLIVLWGGGRLIIEGEISLGTLVAFMGFFSLLIWPTIALGWVVTLVQRGSAALGRINKILETESDIRDPDSPVETTSKGGASLEVRNLTFTYPEREEPVLRDVSFSIRPGEKVALVGRTGAGKSTLIHLLPRLWKVGEGVLFLDGLDINSLRLGELRRQMGFVPQETFLFTDTLEVNILLDEDGEASIDRERIDEAARLAGLSEEVASFPDGFKTLVGERGLTLSGGQKQRTAIARALLRRPRLLVLDDALSSVDTETEEAILDGLFDVDEERTVIIVSHRLSTVRRADRVLVLDEGRLVESGSHGELMNIEGGKYRQLVERQMIAEELEREEP